MLVVSEQARQVCMFVLILCMSVYPSVCVYVCVSICLCVCRVLRTPWEHSTVFDYQGVLIFQVRLKDAIGPSPSVIGVLVFKCPN